jgi:predicted nuclease of predicted toxin-antitoxin system
MLRAHSAEVHVHDDYFAQDAHDDTWLREVGQRGWVVLTKDTRIRLRHTELAALVGGRVRAFVLTRGDLTGEEMARILVSALPRISTFCERYHPPFIARVSRRGTVEMLYDPKKGFR